ncbi:hypothetical protein RJ640_024106 [Escallonia rubra]|uniref:Uncharacterized protein n=1 Tax=Escallonia rubra TaxID=112253 RepID=A0AA88QHZ8_9ASTE|nr:hypothetical protein RJ640_024106 [Escallonia rubra]
MSEVDPTVRELRRRVSRRIIVLHEILDAILGVRMENWDRFLRDWDDATAGIEEDCDRDHGRGQGKVKSVGEGIRVDGGDMVGG